MIGRTIDEINTGDSAEFSKTISESDVYLFAGLTGDLNPAHINEPYANRTFFKTLAPVCIGDTITARVTVAEKNIEKNRITFKTSCFRQDGVLAIDGSAIVSPPKRSK